MQHSGRLAISAVTLGELYTWASRSKAPPTLLPGVLDLLKDVSVLDLNADVGRRFGQVRAGLLDIGLPAPGLDLLIAATALHYGLVMVTHNVRDYASVPGLTVVDWLAP
jgi:tRNA(fMet)-specific endonuclease VapC